MSIIVRNPRTKSTKVYNSNAINHLYLENNGNEEKDLFRLIAEMHD